MAHLDYQESTFDPTVLNANQKDLLLHALNSNKPRVASTDTMAGQEFASPLGQVPGSSNMYDSTPYLDYDVDESGFDWDVNDQLIGDLPGSIDTPDNTNGSVDDDEDEIREKRKNTDDDEGSSKRRESETGNKKPGRKPLTSEPTSKRKAQNRAAQRAFRERKEKHLKDMESKVEDLEKASEAANHENGLLRAQVERLQMELREYRKRLSTGPAAARSSPQSATPSMSAKTSWDINNNFQFAFPKFGAVTAEPMGVGATMRTTDNAAFSRNNSSTNQSRQGSTASPGGNFAAGSMDELSGLFSPDILASVNRSGDGDYVSYGQKSQSPAGGSMSSKKSPDYARSEANSNSPASSANNGFTSSCVTTPEYSAESPEQRKAGEAAFNSISVDEQRRSSLSHEQFPSSASTALQPNTPALDTQGFDWFANQNGGVFDPVLFGDYRDPQENIMSADFGNFFNDAFPPADAGEPQANLLEQPLPKKRDLMKEIEETAVGKEPEMVPGDNPKQFLTCNMLWDRVQRSAKVQSGEADMDDLCSQLKAKAKCSGQGAVIDQKDVDAILGPAPGEAKDFFKMFK